MRTGPRRDRSALLVLSVPAGLLLSGALVWQASQAAFTATVLNEGNKWQAGTVALDTPFQAGPLFTEDALVPGDDGEACLVVTYSGDVQADVALYIDDDPAKAHLVGDLASEIDLEVAEIHGDATETCATFVATATYTGKLDGFPRTHATGLGGWSPSGVESRTYRFRYVLPGDLDDAAQGRVVRATFTWQARSD